MLIRFCVENFLSFKDEVEFSMVAGESEEHPNHTVETGRQDNLRLLKTSVIFGANASGKTNLIKAIDFAIGFITDRSPGIKREKLIPFLLESGSVGRPSRFLFEFKCGNGQHFEYQFALDAKRIHKESLYEILPTSTKLMYEFETNSEGRPNVEIGEALVSVANEEEPSNWVNIRPKELLLTVFSRVENRSAYLDIVFKWFKETLDPIFTDSVQKDGIGLGFMEISDFEEKFLDILDMLDLGIDGIGLTETTDFDTEQFLSDGFKENAKKSVSELPENSNAHAVFYNHVFDNYIMVDKEAQFTVYKVVTKHKIIDEDRMIQFDLDMESDGTRRLLQLVPGLFGLLTDKNEHVFFLDELDRSLHTQLSYKLMELFLENSGNQRSQLIVTTHDTSLLDLDLLRRDEIWFLEKDRHGVSSLFSLEEFNLPDNMDIEKGYLGGRFGAIPILSSYDKIEWAE